MGIYLLIGLLYWFVYHIKAKSLDGPTWAVYSAYGFTLIISLVAWPIILIIDLIEYATKHVKLSENDVMASVTILSPLAIIILLIKKNRKKEPPTAPTEKAN